VSGLTVLGNEFLPTFAWHGVSLDQALR